MTAKINLKFSIALVSYILLAIGSVVLYKERTIFIDTSFYLFEMCRTGQFFIGHFRFGSIFSQLLPLIAIKSGLSLKIVSILYSLSFAIYSMVLYYILWFKLDNKKAATALFVFHVLMCTFTFYWLASELTMALGFCILLVAYTQRFLQKNTSSQNFIFFFPLLLLTTIFFHPFVLFGFSFFTVYLVLVDKVERKNMMALQFMFMIAYLLRTAFIKTPYDESAKSGLGNFAQKAGDFFNLTSTKNFFHYLIHDYYITLLVIIGTILYLVFKRRFIVAIYYFVGLVFLTLMININYPDGGAQFYLENQYNILAFFTSIILVYEVFENIDIKIEAGILGLIAVFGVIRILTSAAYFTDRLDWYRNLLSSTENLPNKKLVIDSKQIPQEKLIMTWCSAYEIWHLSTIEKNDTRSVIIEEGDKEFEWALGNKNTFIQKWGSQNYSELNPRFFILNDTTGYVRK